MSSLICIFTLLLYSAFCTKSEILVSEDKSWISNDNFLIIINLSFPYSLCCNVYLNGSIEGSKALFTQFRSIYPYGYFLNRSSYKCNGYFLLGSNDEEIAKFMENVNLQWKTEILIIIDGYVSNSSKIFDHTLYGLANLNIVSVEETIELCRKISKEIVVECLENPLPGFNGMVQTLVDGLWYADFSLNQDTLLALTYKFAGTKCPVTLSWNAYINMKVREWLLYMCDLEKDGAEMQLFLIMAKKLNFTWTIIKPERIYTYGTHVNETEWKGGMMGMLRDNKADIAFGNIWLIHTPYTFIHLSEPWYQVHIHFLVPRPRRTTSFWALTRPFSVGIWCFLVFVILFHSLYTCTRAWIDPKFPKRFRNFLITLTDLIGCLLSSSVPKTNVNNKLQIVLWRTAGWLIIQAYCSSLAARLASSEYETRIDTIEQFLAANLTWGKTGQVPSFSYYFDLTDPYAVQLTSRYRYVANNTQVRDFIARGNYAIFGHVVDNCFFPHDYVPNEELKNYRLMKQSVGSFYAAFALQPWLLEPVNRIVQSLKESGIATWHLRDIIRKRDSYNLREVLVEHDGYDGSVQVLGLMPLGAGFSLLLVGSSIAALVFYLELKRAAESTLIGEVLRTIDSKRRP